MQFLLLYWPSIYINEKTKQKKEITAIWHPLVLVALLLAVVYFIAPAFWNHLLDTQKTLLRWFTNFRSG